MDRDDIDLEQRLIRVRQAKDGRWRMVPLPVLELLFLAYLGTQLPLQDRALFVGVRGRRLQPTIL